MIFEGVPLTEGTPSFVKIGYRTVLELEFGLLSTARFYEISEPFPTISR